MRALYWDEKPAVKPVIRATYFLAKGHSWLPYSEKDAELLEVRGTPDHAIIAYPSLAFCFVVGPRKLQLLGETYPGVDAEVLCPQRSFFHVVIAVTRFRVH